MTGRPGTRAGQGLRLAAARGLQPCVHGVAGALRRPVPGGCSGTARDFFNEISDVAMTCTASTVSSCRRHSTMHCTHRRAASRVPADATAFAYGTAVGRRHRGVDPDPANAASSRMAGLLEELHPTPPAALHQLHDERGRTGSKRPTRQLRPPRQVKDRYDPDNSPRQPEHRPPARPRDRTPLAGDDGGRAIAAGSQRPLRMSRH